MADKKPSNYDEVADSKIGPQKNFVPAYGGDAQYERKKRDQLAEQAQLAREMGRQQGIQRQQTASERGGVLGTPLAYIERAGQYIGDKFDDADAALSDSLGMKERATFKRGMRQGLQDEGYAKGGSVSSASKRADGIAQRGKTRGKMC